MSQIPWWKRTISRAVAAYPLARGATRLRRLTSPWLVAPIQRGVWARVSGVVDAEWGFLSRNDREPATLGYIRDFLKPGMVFVDVGANVGFFTLAAASIVGPTGRVIAYEPTPTVGKRLEENVKLNRFANVTIRPVAVADKPGSLHFYESADDPEANSVFGSGAHSEVPAVSLDSEQLGKVDLLKIDAEGAEPLVLSGAKKLLAARPTLIIEVNPIALRQAGSSAEDLMAQISSCGYQVRTIEEFSYMGEVVINALSTPIDGHQLEA